jgi:hypothetical protein
LGQSSGLIKDCGISSCSDGFVGVHHDAEGAAAHGAGRQVLGELGADETIVAVAGDDFAPDGLVAGFSLCVLRFVDVGDALSVVESGGLALVASVDLEGSLLLNLGSLTTLKVHEGGLLVKSAATQVRQDSYHSPHGLGLLDTALLLNFLSHLYVM